MDPHQTPAGPDEIRLLTFAGRLPVGLRFREDGRVWRVVAVEPLEPPEPAGPPRGKRQPTPDAPAGARYRCRLDADQAADAPTIPEVVLGDDPPEGRRFIP